MKKSFVMYMSWGEIFDSLSDEDTAKLIRAIYKYEATGEEPDKTWSIYSTFILLRQALDADNKKYEAKCQRLKSNRNQADITPISSRNQDDIELKSDRNQDDINGVTSLSLSNTLSQDDIEKDTELQGYYNDPELNKAFNDYVAYRMQLNKPVDFTRTQRELYDLANGDIKTMTAIIDQSLAQGWIGLFALKDKDTKGKAPPSTYYSDRLAKKMAEQDDTLIEDERFK